MNKKYITPATDVITFNVQQMLAASNPGVKIDSNQSVDAGAVETRQNSGVGSGLWSDMK